MSKHFRPWNPKQKWLLPPEITEFIPEGHASHLVRDMVLEQLNLSAILETYHDERMDFAAVTGFQKPDFRTMSVFLNPGDLNLGLQSP